VQRNKRNEIYELIKSKMNISKRRPQQFGDDVMFVIFFRSSLLFSFLCQNHRNKNSEVINMTLAQASVVFIRKRVCSLTFSSNFKEK
jgi:hypothetical protein